MATTDFHTLILVWLSSIHLIDFSTGCTTVLWWLDQVFKGQPKPLLHPSQNTHTLVRQSTDSQTIKGSWNSHFSSSSPEVPLMKTLRISIHFSVDHHTGLPWRRRINGRSGFCSGQHYRGQNPSLSVGRPPRWALWQEALVELAW